jgi:hypothetical protein
VIWAAEARRGGLHDEDIAAADVLHDLDVDLAIAEPADLRAAERHGQMPGDFMRQLRICIAGEQGDGALVHRVLSLSFIKSGGRKFGPRK